MENNIRPNMTIESLSKLKPSFKKAGTHTPANSTGLTDGATSCIVSSESKAEKLEIKPLSYIVVHDFKIEN